MLRDHKSLAYMLMRVSLGINIFGHGFFRVLNGVGAFANGAVKGMDKGPLPHLLSLSFLYATPWIELVIGMLLILGLFTRLSLAGGALMMIALTVGVTSVQNWATAGTQLEYSAVFFFMLWLLEANTISIDGLLARRNV